MHATAASDARRRPSSREECALHLLLVCEGDLSVRLAQRRLGSLRCGLVPLEARRRRPRLLLRGGDKDPGLGPEARCRRRVDLRALALCVAQDREEQALPRLALLQHPLRVLADAVGLDDAVADLHLGRLRVLARVVAAHQAVLVDALDPEREVVGLLHLHAERHEARLLGELNADQLGLLCGCSRASRSCRRRGLGLPRGIRCRRGGLLDVLSKV
mmetsp:Transcript_76487/g.203123  ORF Transcript_76487/g.203123 Transcript_76487/m.203123 type:complete len:216 (+) Transcript_76487:101-748(+)